MLKRTLATRCAGFSRPSVEAIGESIRVRRIAPRIGQLGEGRIGRIGFAQRQSVLLSFGYLMTSCARVSILWGGPV